MRSTPSQSFWWSRQALALYVQSPPGKEQTDKVALALDTPHVRHIPQSVYSQSTIETHQAPQQTQECTGERFSLACASHSRYHEAVSPHGGMPTCAGQLRATTATRTGAHLLPKAPSMAYVS